MLQYKLENEYISFNTVAVAAAVVAATQDVIIMFLFSFMNNMHFGISDWRFGE